jgi:type VI secretion system protein ImpG
MRDELLDYYNHELTFIRKLAAEFAETNADVAAHLRIKGDRVEDPHVERLIEAFALLNARTQLRLDDDFPEITDAILSVLYPHYLSPIPSMAIVQFAMDKDKAGTNGCWIQRGTKVESVVSNEAPLACEFRTCYRVQLWPIKVAEATLQTPPFEAPAPSFNSKSMLRLRLDCISPKAKFSDLRCETADGKPEPLDQLRFYIKEQPPNVHYLYELILNHAQEVIVASSQHDETCVRLSPDAIQPVGFEPDQAMLKYPPHSFAGYRLLTEYFVFPEKFLFFDVCQLGGSPLRQAGTSLYLYIYFNRHIAGLSSVSDAFQLGACPVVNLFENYSAEPISLTHTDSEYHVKPSEKRPQAYEIYSIDRVVATSPDDKVIEYRPFYSFQHGSRASKQRAYWYAFRRPSGYRDGHQVSGTEVYLVLVDLDFQPSLRPDWTLDVVTTCLNRDLPSKLPFGGDKPKLQVTSGPRLDVRCLTRPTQTFRRLLGKATRWHVMSHLSLNHLSLLDGSGGADVLREILGLYNFADSPDVQNAIESIARVDHRRIDRRISHNGSSVICRGVEVIITFDEDRRGAGTFLFASVLERFLALYTSINSFTKLTARSKKRDEVIREWEPRVGDKPLV